MHRRLMTAGLAAAAAGAGAVVGLSLVSGPAASDDRHAPPPEFPRNAAGQTYGSDAEVDREEDVPDLIAAYATNGKEGYVKDVDLNEEPPASPAEAIARQEKLEARFAPGDVVRTIPVHAADGTTVIGEFEIVRSFSGGSTEGFDPRW